MRASAAACARVKSEVADESAPDCRWSRASTESICGSVSVSGITSVPVSVSVLVLAPLELPRLGSIRGFRSANADGKSYKT